jgi:hypothetical protein
MTTSLIHGGTPETKETSMNTQISTKLAALALALLMNSTMIGGIAYVFSMQGAQAGVVTPVAV